MQEELNKDQVAMLRSALKKNREDKEKEYASWWEGLTEDEREKAFFSVTKLIHKAEIKDEGSYRYAMYDVFGFSSSMYETGMHSGYFDIHNLIHTGLEQQAMNNINRLEVIDKTGRAYTHHFSGNEKVQYSLQDNNRTLKIFIDEFGSTVYDNAK